jgi:hypothetical protein
MKKLARIILDDVKSQINSNKFSKVLDDIGTIYSDSIESMNRKSLEPDGSDRFPLVESYAKYKSDIGRKPEPDFFYTGDADATFMYQAKKKSVSFGYSDSSVANYMEDHEQGYGVPQRRQFPVEQDSSSSEQQSNIEDVKTFVFDLLNEKRTIHADLIINMK